MRSAQPNQTLTVLLRTLVLVVFGLTLGGCDFLNPFGGDESGASGKIAGKSGKAAKTTSDKESKAQKQTGEADKRKTEASAETPDTGTETQEQGELTVPEPTPSQKTKQSTRNPFEPKIQTQDDTEDDQPTPMAQREPLQRYSIGQLKLAAIISGVAVPKAMFIAPDGMGHMVQEGDRVGQEGGEIVDIRSNAVELSIPQGPEEPAVTQTLELAARGVGAGARAAGSLTEQERQMLDRLMESEEGREALRERYQGDSQQGQSPPSGGLQPPGDGQTQNTER